jgi:hypothetical protein
MNKEMIVDAIIGGTTIPHSQIDEYEEKGLGHWTGGFVDSWTWNRKGLEKLGLEELKYIYTGLKIYWKDQSLCK